MEGSDQHIPAYLAPNTTTDSYCIACVLWFSSAATCTRLAVPSGTFTHESFVLSCSDHQLIVSATYLRRKPIC